jgi:hypothetical protein
MRRLKIENDAANGSGTVFDGCDVECGQTANSFTAPQLENVAIMSLPVDCRNGHIVTPI